MIYNGYIFIDKTNSTVAISKQFHILRCNRVKRGVNKTKPKNRNAFQIPLMNLPKSSISSRNKRQKGISIQGKCTQWCKNFDLLNDLKMIYFHYLTLPLNVVNFPQKSLSFDRKRERSNAEL